MIVRNTRQVNWSWETQFLFHSQIGVSLVRFWHILSTYNTHYTYTYIHILHTFAHFILVFLIRMLVYWCFHCFTTEFTFYNLDVCVCVLLLLFLYCTHSPPNSNFDYNSHTHICKCIILCVGVEEFSLSSFHFSFVHSNLVYFSRCWFRYYYI